MPTDLFDAARWCCDTYTGQEHKKGCKLELDENNDGI